MQVARALWLLVLGWLLVAPLAASAATGTAALRDGQRGSEADAFELRLDVRLDPAARMLVVRAEVQPAERDFRFVLHESLMPRAASAAGRPLKLQPAGQRGSLRGWRVQVPDGAPLSIEYSGTLAVLERGRDHRGVLQGMPPMAAPEGSFLPAGSAWYPRPAELFSYRVELSVPGEQRALVAGRLVEEALPSAADPRYRAVFEFDQRSDGIDLMAGPWAVREHKHVQADGRPLRLRTYFPHALDTETGLAEGYLADSLRYIEHYSERIGAYPFTEFSVVASPLPTGFGMPTLTYIGEQVLRLPFIRATSLGHEVLHNWWGNGVLVDYMRGNWSEGLTTFMADYAYKEAESAEAAREMRLGWLRDFAAVPAGGHQPLAAFRSRTHAAAAAVGYGKAAMVFVMLRDRLGEEVFERGIRLFWAQQRFRIAGWAELQAAFEQVSGESLEGFFRQWVALPGGPQVRVVAASIVDAGGGQARVDDGLAGGHSQDTSGARVRISLAQDEPLHTLDLPLVVHGESAREMRWVRLEATSADVELDFDFEPVQLHLDPELRVWRLPEAEQLPPILRQWVLARSPHLVIADAQADMVQAASALAQRIFERSPKASGVEALTRGREPVLLVGSHDAIDAVLADHGLPARPEALRGRGTAQVWTLAQGDGPPLAVVSAQDPAALEALLRPLPHYGGQSWLVFDGSRVVARGVWDAPGRAVAVGR